MPCLCCLPNHHPSKNQGRSNLSHVVPFLCHHNPCPCPCPCLHDASACFHDDTITILRWGRDSSQLLPWRRSAQLFSSEMIPKELQSTILVQYSMVVYAPPYHSLKWFFQNKYGISSHWFCCCNDVGSTGCTVPAIDLTDVPTAHHSSNFCFMADC